MCSVSIVRKESKTSHSGPRLTVSNLMGSLSKFAAGLLTNPLGCQRLPQFAMSRDYGGVVGAEYC